MPHFPTVWRRHRRVLPPNSEAQRSLLRPAESILLLFDAHKLIVATMLMLRIVQRRNAAPATFNKNCCIAALRA